MNFLGDKGEYKNIEDIKIGDKVLSYDESNYIKKWLSDITYSKALRLKNDNKNNKRF
jgi:hypothetical protein